MIPALLTRIDSGPSCPLGQIDRVRDLILRADVADQRQSLELVGHGLGHREIAVKDGDPRPRGMKPAGDAGPDPAAASRHQRHLAV